MGRLRPEVQVRVIDLERGDMWYIYLVPPRAKSNPISELQEKETNNTISFFLSFFLGLFHKNHIISSTHTLLAPLFTGVWYLNHQLQIQIRAINQLAHLTYIPNIRW